MGTCPVNLTDVDLSLSFEYLFRKGSKEVKEFNKESHINKIAVEKGVILFCRSRILEGQRFLVMGGLEDMDMKLDVGLNFNTPVLDRYSPLSYSIAHYIHYHVVRPMHSGMETCYRTSLGYCHIMQGFGLFKEVGDDCVGCAKLRQKYLDVAMGPVSDQQLTVSPPFWITMCDLDGPINVFVPGHEH